MLAFWVTGVARQLHFTRLVGKILSAILLNSAVRISADRVLTAFSTRSGNIIMAPLYGNKIQRVIHDGSPQMILLISTQKASRFKAETQQTGIAPPCLAIWSPCQLRL